MRPRPVFGRARFLVTPTVLLLVNAHITVAGETSSYDTDRINDESKAVKGAEFKAIVGTALALLFLGALASLYVLYRSYLTLSATPFGLVSGSLRLPIYTALICEWSDR
jgi:hypothetical protein